MANITIGLTSKGNILRENNMNKIEVYRRQKDNSFKEASVVYASELKADIIEFIKSQKEKREKETPEASAKKIAEALKEMPERPEHLVNGNIVKKYKTVCIDGQLLPDGLLIANNYLPQDNNAPARVGAALSEVYSAVNKYLDTVEGLMTKTKGQYEYDLDTKTNQLVDKKTGKPIPDGSILDKNKVKRTIKTMMASESISNVDQLIEIREQNRRVEVKGKHLQSIEFRTKSITQTFVDEQGNQKSVAISVLEASNVVGTNEVRNLVQEVITFLPTDKSFARAPKA